MMDITQGLLHRIFSYDAETGILTRRESRCGRAMAGNPVGHADYKGYLRVGINGRQWSVHRLIWLYVHGVWPACQIDHVNGIKSDNRLCNLRESTNSQNTCNRDVRPESQSRIKGVTLDKRTGRWRAYIGLNGKRINLGFYATKAEAADRRINASCLHGEFARETRN